MSTAADKKSLKEFSLEKQFLTPKSNGKPRKRTRSCESNVKLQNETMLDYMRRFVDAEKNFSIEKLKKSVSTYDKLSKFNSKEIRGNSEGIDTPTSPEIISLSSLSTEAPDTESRLQPTQAAHSEFLCCDKKIQAVQNKKCVVHQDNSISRSGTHWEFVLSMYHDKRLHWFMQPMNWIKLCGEILLYENNCKILTRKFVICNFSVETPFIPKAVTKVEASQHPRYEEKTTRSHRYELERFDVSPTKPQHRLWIDTTMSYYFRVSDENLRNFNLILFVIPNPVVLDSDKEIFNNGWKLVTVVIPKISLGVQNVCHYVHDIPFPDRMYNKRGTFQPWWSYHFQILWECNSRRKSFAAWNGVLEFQNPFDQIRPDGLDAKVLISSASFHSGGSSNPRFVPRPSLCNHDSFVEGSSLTIVKDIFLPKSLQCDGPCTVQVPSFSYFVALPKATEHCESTYHRPPNDFKRQRFY